MLKKIKANACVLGHSLNLSQHIDVEQDRGKRLCFRSTYMLNKIGVNAFGFEAFSKSLEAHRC